MGLADNRNRKKGSGYPAKWPLLILLASLVIATGGCLDEAADTCLAWDNANDPEVGTTSCDETGSDSSSQIQIISVDYANDVVILLNSGLTDQDLSGWSLENTAKTPVVDIFSFTSFTLTQGRTVRVHSASGTNDADDLFWDGGDHWGNVDEATLKDSAGIVIDICDPTETCWN